jgi:multimeric flavodoxin WrbA
MGVTMKVLAINGSPRKNGNTHKLIQHVFEPLIAGGFNSEVIQIGGLSIHGCKACMRCKETKNLKCSTQTDVMNDIIQKVYNADILLLASPTYFADITSEMKAFIDRLGYVSNANGRFLEKKIGSPIVAVRRGGAIHAFDSMMHFIHIQGMISIGSTYWNMGIGRNPGEVEQDEEGVRNMRNLGQSLLWLSKKIF